jgi:hypothetical protein
MNTLITSPINWGMYKKYHRKALVNDVSQNADLIFQRLIKEIIKLKKKRK